MLPAPAVCARQKNGGARGAAKFREETSKKQTTAARPRCCGAQSSRSLVRMRAVLCNAAFHPEPPDDGSRHHGHAPVMFLEAYVTIF
jgi:hypothetical protein